MKNKIAMAVAVFAALPLGFQTSYSDELIPKGSVAPKFILFFPNDDTSGLKDFSTGFGGGVEARFNVMSSTTLGIYVGPEIEYIDFSTYKETYSDIDFTYESKVTFSTYKIKANFLLVVPLQKISFFFGGGIVYNQSTMDWEITIPGYGSTSLTLSGSGIGGQMLCGIDLLLGERGALSFEFTIPLSQSQDMEASYMGESLSLEDMNVGGTELNVGYRFYF